MTQVMFNNGVAMSLGSVSREEELRPDVSFLVNAPPEDRACDVCGKPISELKPFGGPGDPLVGDFTGELLIKNFRRDGPYDEEADNAWKQAEKELSDGKNHLDWLISKFGIEKGKELYSRVYLYESISKSWECRDCIVLDHDEYFKKIAERYKAAREKKDLRRRNVT